MGVTRYTAGQEYTEHQDAIHMGANIECASDAGSSCALPPLVPCAHLRALHGP